MIEHPELPWGFFDTTRQPQNSKQTERKKQRTSRRWCPHVDVNGRQARCTKSTLWDCTERLQFVAAMICCSCGWLRLQHVLQVLEFGRSWWM
eukprot:833020-Amphidinium_carterae.1